MSHIINLRRCLQSFVAISVLAVTGLAFTSCHDESHYIGSEEDRYANGFYIDGQRAYVASAGVYFSEADQGYNMFFSSEVENLTSGKIADRASRKYLAIDIPACKIGKRYKLDASFDSDFPNDFLFYLSTDHFPGFHRIQTGLEDVVDGFVELTLEDLPLDSYHKKMHFAFRAKIRNGRVIECQYDGLAQDSQKYIGWWSKPTE